MKVRDSYFYHLHCIDLIDKVRVTGGEISWSLLYHVHEKDAECQANLRAAPKLSNTLLHPGNCKQSVPVALAIFDLSTIAAILKFFPQAQDSADFIIFSCMVDVSNSKQRFRNGHRLRDAAVEHVLRPHFFGSLLGMAKREASKQ